MADAGYPVDQPCGGKGICGKCGVKASGTFTDKNSLRTFKADHQTRILSCVALIAGEAAVYGEKPLPAEERSAAVLFGSGDIAIAADIGTTSIQISAVELSSRKKFRMPSILNPQRRFGHDVISRIAAANDPSSAAALGALARDAVAYQIRQFLEAGGIPPERIKKIVIAGNTAMTYLTLGIDATPLGIFPYAARVLDFNSVDPGIFGIPLLDAEVSAIPCASAFLGGDLVGGLTLCESLGYKKNVFFIDMGTNGEIFVRGRGGIITASSCAMGPALEGMGVSMGMTAAPGAVSRVSINEGKIESSVIGDTAAAGICGTGLIDLIALSLELGLIDPTGLIRADKKYGEPPEGIAADRGAGIITIRENISVTQKDIRSLQLAKGASLAASEILLEEAGIEGLSIDRVIIAGSLGENLNIDSFKKLSFLPEFRNAEWITLGNTSLHSAEEAARDKNFFERCAQLRDSLKGVELAAHAEFSARFIEALGF